MQCVSDAVQGLTASLAGEVTACHAALRFEPDLPPAVLQHLARPAQQTVKLKGSMMHAAADNFVLRWYLCPAADHAVLCATSDVLLAVNQLPASPPVWLNLADTGLQDQAHGLSECQSVSHHILWWRALHTAWCQISSGQPASTSTK